MDNRQKVFSNLIWRFMERFGSQAVSFVVSIVLARLLEPELYGSVALVLVIISILQVFVDSGRIPEKVPVSDYVLFDVMQKAADAYTAAKS